MGTFIEINDTLQITVEQGFPAEIFDYQQHLKQPVQLTDVEHRIFEFRNKVSARIYQLDPVRVFFVHNINNKWLFWGHALIQTLNIQKHLQTDGTWDGKSWLTSGTYIVTKVYDPEFQRSFTNTEAPDDRNFFKHHTSPDPMQGN